MAYGFYKVGQGNVVRREEKEEKLEARKALVPFLQAEEDRRWVKAYEEFKERECRALKNVSLHASDALTGHLFPFFALSSYDFCR